MEDKDLDNEFDFLLRYKLKDIQEASKHYFIMDMITFQFCGTSLT